MQSPQQIDYKSQIDEAVKRAKCKKVLYFYDESGNRELVGVFSLKKASQIKQYFRSKQLINRLAEFEVRTTEPDSQFKYS